MSEARFTDDTIEGLGFSVQDVVDGKTDSAGTFKVVQGRRVDFFVGDGANRVVVGRIALTGDDKRAVVVNRSIDASTATVASDTDKFLQ